MMTVKMKIRVPVNSMAQKGFIKQNLNVLVDEAEAK